MNARAVVNEFAKMRRQHVGLLAVVMVLPVLALALYSLVSSPGLDVQGPQGWEALLAGMSLGIPLLLPLLLAVIASRQTDMEHQGGGWLLQAGAGITPGTLCRAKLVALGTVVTAVTVIGSLLVLATGRLLVGIEVAPPLGRWAGFTACMLAVNLVVLALQVLVSAAVENQLVALGIGVLGSIVAVFSQGLPPLVRHLTPWGYYSLAQASDYRVDRYVAVDIAYPSIAGLAIVAAVCVALITRRMDRQEA